MVRGLGLLLRQQPPTGVLFHPGDLLRWARLVDCYFVWVESEAGRVRGQLKVTEGIHPEVVAMASTFGHWAQGMPVARGKGVHFNSLLATKLERVDMVSGALDACVRVKVYRE